MTKDEVLRALTDWERGLLRLERIEEQLASGEYRVTPTLSHNGSMGGGGFRSKVEDFCLDRLGLDAQRTRIKKQQEALMLAIANCGLSQTQLGALRCVMQGEKLSRYARSRDICISSVYKMRDSAATKVAAYLEKNTKIARFEW